MIGVFTEVAQHTPDAWEPFALAAWVGDHNRRLNAKREASRDPIRRKVTRKAWEERNREKMRAYYAKVYAAKKAAPPPRVSRAERDRGHLTADDVRAIRALGGTLSGRKIAARFGVTHHCICAVLRGETWRDVT